MAGIIMADSRLSKRPMSTAERAGFQVILGQLSTDETLMLTKTVTNGLVTPENRAEAVKAIVDYSENAEQLLRRHKIKKEYLFHYLRSQNIIVSPTLEKPLLIQKILEHWRKQTGHHQTKKVAIQAKPSHGHQSPQIVAFQQNTIHVHQSPQIVAFQQNTTHVHQSPQIAAVQLNTIHGHQSSSEPPVSAMHQMGVQFATWFYQMLNSNNPLNTQSHNEWGPQHFWIDAKLKLLVQHTEQHMETVQGADLVCQRLLALVQEDELLFAPNISANGIKASENCHGLVLVTVCGTIHRAANCVGVFEQTFGLIRDPYSQNPTGNTYKIKQTNLMMQAQSRPADQVPVLDNNPQTLAIE